MLTNSNLSKCAWFHDLSRFWLCWQKSVIDPVCMWLLTTASGFCHTLASWKLLAWEKFLVPLKLACSKCFTYKTGRLGFSIMFHIYPFCKESTATNPQQNRILLNINQIESVCLLIRLTNNETVCSRTASCNASTIHSFSKCSPFVSITLNKEYICS